MLGTVITFSIKNIVNSSRNVLKNWFYKFIRENFSSTSSLTLLHIKKLSSKQETFFNKNAAENIIFCVKIQHSLLDGSSPHQAKLGCRK